MSGQPTTALLRARVLPQCAAHQRPSSTPAATPGVTGAAGRRLVEQRSVPRASVGLCPPETLERPAQHDNIQSSRQEGRAEADRGAAGTPTEAAGGGGGAAELLPKLSLLGAAALWGSYAPSVRLLYESANPPDAVVVMAARGILQSLVLLGASLALQRATDSSSGSSAESSAASGSGADAASSSSSSGSGSGNAFEDWLFLRSPKLWQAALELGFFNYSATALQTLGLQLVGATRASFLVQATVLLTPLLSTLAGYRPGRRVWAACGMALFGCLLITADEATAEASSGAGLAAAGLQLGGDGAILAAALFYSLAVVRMTGYARSLPSVQIATWKSVVLGSLALGALAVAATNADGLAALWGGYSDPASWAALGWAGLGPGALASYLHVMGQKHVAPAQAQVIFSSKPLWAAGLAWVLLGGEELGPLTWAGGAAVAAAGLVASTAPPEEAEPQQQAQQQQAAAKEE